MCRFVSGGEAVVASPWRVRRACGEERGRKCGLVALDRCRESSQTAHPYPICPTPRLRAVGGRISARIRGSAMRQSEATGENGTDCSRARRRRRAGDAPRRGRTLSDRRRAESAGQLRGRAGRANSQTGEHGARLPATGGARGVWGVKDGNGRRLCGDCRRSQQGPAAMGEGDAAGGRWP